MASSITSKLISSLLSPSYARWSYGSALLASVEALTSVTHVLDRSQSVASCSFTRESSRWYSGAPTYKARSPAGVAIAAGLVAPDSRILIHYKKNIDRPQLTARIMKRRQEQAPCMGAWAHGSPLSLHKMVCLFKAVIA